MTDPPANPDDRVSTVAQENSTGQNEDGEPVQLGVKSLFLRRELNSAHMIFIAISGTIGSGLFFDSGKILHIAGPGGGTVAIIIVSICITFIMEGIAEMIIHWPVSFALQTFIEKFVDPDLASVVGFAYCYASLIAAAAQVSTVWNWPSLLQGIVFILIVQVVLIYINLRGVRFYGYVEIICGALKILLVVIAFIVACVVSQERSSEGKIGSSYFNDGLQNNTALASSHGAAVIISIPTAAFAFIGVEIVTVTAGEAKRPTESVKIPAKYIAYITSAIYITCFIAFYFVVKWTDPLLPEPNSPTNFSSSTLLTGLSIVTIYCREHPSLGHLTDFINALLVLAILSTANTALFVASRTLRGIAPKDAGTEGEEEGEGKGEESPTRSVLSRIAHGIAHWQRRKLFILRKLTPKTKVPGHAMFASILPLCWIPLLHFFEQVNYFYFIEVLGGAATTGVIIVWGSQCFAFIRYRRFIQKYQSEISDAGGTLSHARGEEAALPFASTLSSFQPFPAYVGLAFCVATLTVFPFFQKSLRHPVGDLLADILGPAVFCSIYLFLKVKKGIHNILKKSAQDKSRFSKFMEAFSLVQYKSWDSFKATLSSLDQAKIEG